MARQICRVRVPGYALSTSTIAAILVLVLSNAVLVLVLEIPAIFSFAPAGSILGVGFSIRPAPLAAPPSVLAIRTCPSQQLSSHFAVAASYGTSIQSNRQKKFQPPSIKMGKRIALSNGRRLVDDVIRMANQMPIAGLSGDFDFGKVAEFRKQTRPKIAWNVLFMKAYAQVCRQSPQLRQGYSKFPWPHLYEHDDPVCMMTIAREYQGEERLFFARFAKPDQFTLEQLQQQYDHYRRAPVESIKQFRHQIKFAKAPAVVRRFAWWMLFNVWPEKRATHMGTYGMSISGHHGVYGSKHLGPNTTTLGVDTMPRKGQARLMLTFDHRVMDGTPATRVFQQLQHMMKSIITLELANMIGVDHRTGLPLTDLVPGATADAAPNRAA